MSTKKSIFPKRLYVRRECERDGEYYLICYETPRECADLEEDRLVAIYDYVKEGKIKIMVSGLD